MRIVASTSSQGRDDIRGVICTMRRWLVAGSSAQTMQPRAGIEGQKEKIDASFVRLGAIVSPTSLVRSTRGSYCELEICTAMTTRCWLSVSMPGWLHVALAQLNVTHITVIALKIVL